MSARRIAAAVGVLTMVMVLAASDANAQQSEEPNKRPNLIDGGRVIRDLTGAEKIKLDRVKDDSAAADDPAAADDTAATDDTDTADEHDHTTHFHPFSTGAYALYAAIITAIVGPVIVIWWRRRVAANKGADDAY